jgi:hypothetical protein
MRAWFNRVITFAGLVATVTGLMWLGTVMWTGADKEWFERHVWPIVLVSGIACLFITAVVDRFSAHERRSLTTPRTITNGQAAALAAIRAEFDLWQIEPAVHRVAIVVASTDPEAGRFAQDLQHVSHNAGWVPYVCPIDDLPATSGIRVEVWRHANNAESCAATLLSAWLGSLGLRPRLGRMPEQVGFRFRGLRQMPIIECAVRITIGVRS